MLSEKNLKEFRLCVLDDVWLDKVTIKLMEESRSKGIHIFNNVLLESPCKRMAIKMEIFNKFVASDGSHPATGAILKKVGTLLILCFALHTLLAHMYNLNNI